MSMENYGQSGYGFCCMTADYDRVRAFIAKHLTGKGQELFRDCEYMEDIEEICSHNELFGSRFNVTGILAYVISVKTEQDVQLCGDDSGEDWVMLLPSYPWEVRKLMDREDFKKQAGELALEFFGEPVRFDYHTTEEWG